MSKKEKEIETKKRLMIATEEVFFPQGLRSGDAG